MPSKIPLPTTTPGPRASTPPKLKPDSPWAKLALHRVPPSYILVAAFVSYIILALAYIQGVVIWLGFGLAIAPWLVIVFLEIEWTYEHFGWFAAFGAIAFVQTIHYSEHCIQIIQYHLFNQTAHESQAIFSSLNREGVHFVGDSLLTVGTLLLLYKFPRNPWLWVALPFQIIHEAEHV